MHSARQPVSETGILEGDFNDDSHLPDGDTTTRMGCANEQETVCIGQSSDSVDGTGVGGVVTACKEGSGGDEEGSGGDVELSFEAPGPHMVRNCAVHGSG